ncbi:hypothetical protein LPJ53_006454, partial [Coemansia erecta]
RQRQRQVKDSQTCLRPAVAGDAVQRARAHLGRQAGGLWARPLARHGVPARRRGQLQRVLISAAWFHIRQAPAV